MTAPVPPASGLHELVAASAARHPDRPAVVGADETLSYRQLDRWAGTIASALAAGGVTRGDRVVVVAAKTPRVVAAMQAVLRLGAAYVPVDPAAPAARTRAIVDDCRARAVVGAAPALTELAAPAGICRLDPDTLLPRGHATDAPDEFSASVPKTVAVAGDDLAFILYTSGSTGRPKGVCVSHRNARAFVDWAVEELAADCGDRFANNAALTFDLSVLDLYGAFSVGASVHLIPAELAYAPTRLVELLHRHRITVWYSVPAVLSLMIRDGGLLARPAPSCLRAILFAGEPFPIAPLRALAGWSPARLLNLYGPTETNVCTFHQVEPADLERDRPVPIGRAASGATVCVRGPDGGTAGIGEEGEICVEGPSVMLGYWGREPQRGEYRTGDVGRLLPDGTLEFLGRRDQLVKVRGHRVELGEVEAALGTHPDVDEAVAVAAGAGLDRRIEAFVVPVAGRRPGVLALKRHSALRLPRHMIADAIHVVPALPRNGNGKVDRAALARQAAEHGAGDSAGRTAKCPTTSWPQT